MSDTFDVSHQQTQGSAPQPEEKEEERRGAGLWWWFAALLAVTVLVGGSTYYYFAGLMEQQAIQIQAAKEQAQKELALKEQAAREAAARERAAKEQAAKEQAERELAAKEQAAREAAAREQAAKEQAAKEQAERELAAKEQAAKEAAAREQAAKELAAKELAAKEQEAREAAAREQAAKEQGVKDHAAKEKVENAYVFRIDGKDGQGRAASFDFIILAGDYAWALGSSTEVVSKGTAIPEAEVAGRVLTPKIRESLSSASDLIAVGLASLEGERQREEARAMARAKTIAGWMAKESNPSTPLWTLTLGQYNKDCKRQEDADTSFERPLIFTGVRTKAEGTNLQEALADAISGHDNLPSRECYSRFDLAKVR